MNHSETISKIAAALCKVQGNLSGAKKDSKNPYFKSNYADLESVWDACRQLLHENELAVTQTTSMIEEKPYLITTLIHSSGEWINSILPLYLPRFDSQTLGSALTYARRYALAAIVGVVQTDDDGNAATRPDKAQNMNYGPGPDKDELTLAEKTHLEMFIEKSPALAEKIQKKLKLNDLKQMKKEDYERLIDFMNQKEKVHAKG